MKRRQLDELEKRMNQKKIDLWEKERDYLKLTVQIHNLLLTRKPLEKHIESNELRTKIRNYYNEIKEGDILINELKSQILQGVEKKEENQNA